MANKTNFLLGNGESLTHPIQLPPHGGPLRHPYTFDEAKAHLAPQAVSVASELDKLPDMACPRDLAVGIMTLHPQYIAKSFYPTRLLKTIGLETVGSRSADVMPRKWRPRPERSRKKSPDPLSGDSIEIFVSGKRDTYRQWAEALPSWTEAVDGADKLFEVETFRAATLADRLRPITTDATEPLLEVVLHVPKPFIIESFEAFLAGYGLRAEIDRRFQAGTLCFMPLRSPRELIDRIATFSFLRVMREMPRLRPLRPLARSFAGLDPFVCDLPKDPPVDGEVRAVVFDGGLPADHQLSPWVTAREADNVGQTTAELTEHGLAVTSALLFGPIEAGAPLPRPFAQIEHVRVLDSDSDKDEDLYDVLARIRAVLDSGKYQFVNLSIGPYLPVEENDVHAWTVMLDQYLAKEQALATIAVGNSGHLDHASGNARVQVPSDCVNAVAVGACDRKGPDWRRASYSSLGPGRSPGLVKPDVLSFGGWDGEPYWVLDAARHTHAAPTFGTSFASPSVLRTALGVRAHFGEVLTPLAIRTLLIHGATDDGHNRFEVGWGRVTNDLSELVTCPDGAARIVYQGDLNAGRTIRAQIPMPEEMLEGKVSIHATVCFATETDPAHPCNYTRSGVEVAFRPHRDRGNAKSGLALAKPFFKSHDYCSEAELRRDAHKWETVLNGSKRMLAKSLKDPVFDISYRAREESQPCCPRAAMRYALIVTVYSSKTSDFYDRIVRRYRNHLTPILPTIQIPVRTSGV